MSRARPVMVIGVRYNSIADAARALGLNPGTVHTRVNRAEPEWREWQFVDADTNGALALPKIGILSRRAALFAALALSGCADIATLGAASAEHRRTMNDMQARGTMAATCDLSYGAVMRLQAHERRAVELLCGVPERLEASE